MEDNIIDLQRKVKVLNDENNKMYKEIERLKGVYEKNLELVDKMYVKDKEIERLNKELQDTKEHLGEYLYEQEEENKKLKNIIKEVREYIKDKWEMELKDSMEDFLDHDELVDRKRLLYILEILDKEK